MTDYEMMTAHPHDLIVPPYSRSLGWISGCTFSAEIDEAEGTRRSSLVHGIEANFRTILANAFDFCEVELSMTKRCDGDSPVTETPLCQSSQPEDGYIRVNTPDACVGTGELGLDVIGIVPIVLYDYTIYLRGVNTLIELDRFAGHGDDLGDLGYVQGLSNDLGAQQTSRTSNDKLHRESNILCCAQS